MMIKLLINDVTGEQKILSLHETGSYFDLTRVLWDERIDGSLPAVTLGKMTRVGNTLQTQSSFLTEHQAYLDAVAAKAADDQRAQSILDELKTDPALIALRGLTSAQIDTYFANNVTTLANVINILKRLVKVLVRNI